MVHQYMHDTPRLRRVDDGKWGEGGRLVRKMLTSSLHPTLYICRRKIRICVLLTLHFGLVENQTVLVVFVRQSKPRPLK